ncbi:DUF1822 family protein [Calothrix sp. PCC 7507]|uniref:DUF1822 family protein n=1 Tax=Calothrix sp. PCC 7507 TaxID=99598 RepID=UPI00029EE6EA|nr:DUF1822 family protein [Calothrix sp. PCC 7507]AFY34505.1 protein of unknown function DUF1822 [Calothrix sp. PCC 7507]
MFNSPASITIDQNQFYLELPATPETPEQPYSTNGSRQRAWINQLCLDAFLPWLRAEIIPNARVYPHVASLPSFWELVNGTAIIFDNTRLVLIPTLAVDGDELRVSQEWVDIPDWVADYYLAVQVNPDDGWMKIYGYTTHQQLKTIGVYDTFDRTYSLEREDLIQDLNVLWVTHQLNYQEVLRAEIAPLPLLPQTQAENLLARLGNSDVKFPGLSVPFSLWGALLAHGGWRKRLYELRQGISGQYSIQTWLQAGVSNFAQQMGWGQREFVLAPSGMRSAESILGLSRQLIIAGDTYELRIFPGGNREEHIWRFELRSTSADATIPIGLKLRLLTEDLQPFENNEDIATTPVNILYLEVVLQPGEGLVWEIEPTPEDWEREIIRF